MKKYIVLILFVLCASLLLTACGESYSVVTLFDNTITIERIRSNVINSDHLTIVFTEPGTYDVAFYKVGKGSLPQNVSIEVTNVPNIFGITKYSIPSLKVSITEDGLTESAIVP